MTKDTGKQVATTTPKAERLDLSQFDAEPAALQIPANAEVVISAIDEFKRQSLSELLAAWDRDYALLNDLRQQNLEINATAKAALTRAYQEIDALILEKAAWRKDREQLISNAAAADRRAETEHHVSSELQIRLDQINAVSSPAPVRPTNGGNNALLTKLADDISDAAKKN